MEQQRAHLAEGLREPRLKIVMAGSKRLERLVGVENDRPLDVIPREPIDLDGLDVPSLLQTTTMCLLQSFVRITLTSLRETRYAYRGDTHRHLLA